MAKKTRKFKNPYNLSDIEFAIYKYLQMESKISSNFGPVGWIYINHYKIIKKFSISKRSSQRYLKHLHDIRVIEIVTFSLQNEETRDWLGKKTIIKIYSDEEASALHHIYLKNKKIDTLDFSYTANKLSI